jgi:hypothetical protein
MVTGLSYEDAVKKFVSVPVGMNGTSFLPLSERNMVIPPVNGELWSSSFNQNNPYVVVSFYIELG